MKICPICGHWVRRGENCSYCREKHLKEMRKICKNILGLGVSKNA